MLTTGLVTSLGMKRAPAMFELLVNYLEKKAKTLKKYSNAYMNCERQWQKTRPKIDIAKK